MSDWVSITLPPRDICVKLFYRSSLGEEDCVFCCAFQSCLTSMEIINTREFYTTTDKVTRKKPEVYKDGNLQVYQ